MKKIKTVILSLIFFSSVFGQSVETTGFSPNEIRPNSIANYTLVFKDLKGNVDISKIPLPDGLRIVGQNASRNHSIINGKMSSSTSISLAMQASKEGTLTIPEWKIEIGGKTFDIKAATLNVSENAKEQLEDPFDVFSNVFGFSNGFSQRQMQRNQQMQRQTQSFESNLRNNAKLEIKLERENIYVGECVPCELIFSFEKSLIEEGFTLAQLIPEIKKADDFDMPAFSKKPIIDTSSDNSRVLIKYDTTITPLKVGSYDLDFAARGAFNRDMRAENLFGMSIFDRMSSLINQPIPFEINMPSKKIEVLDLPKEGKPENFTGAIGNFSLEDVSVNPDALTVGEPCTIIAKIIGVGNFPRIQEPKLDAGTDWKTYKAKSSFSDESNGHSNIGIKTFEYTIVPKKADLPYAPAVLFNYFNPTTKKYVEVKSSQIAVSVAPTGRSKRAKAMEEASPKPALDEIIETPDSTTNARIFESIYFWLGQIVILAILTIFILAKRESFRRKNDKVYAKNLSCKNNVKIYLKRAKQDIARGEIRQFFENAKTSLQYALAVNSEKEARTITVREAIEIMRDKNFDETEIANITELFEGADAITYGAKDLKDIDLSQVSKNLELLSNKILKRK